MTECVFCGSEEAYPSQYGTFCIPCATIVGEIVETHFGPNRRGIESLKYILGYSKDAEDDEVESIRIQLLEIEDMDEDDLTVEDMDNYNNLETRLWELTGGFEAEDFEAIEFREMPQLSARDVELAKQIAIYEMERAELFEAGELTKAIEKEIDEAIENIFNQMSPEAQNPWGAETFEAPYVGSDALMDIGKNTDLSSFTTSELTKSSSIHGDFDTASLDYSGHQNIEVRCETFGAETTIITAERHSQNSGIPAEEAAWKMFGNPTTILDTTCCCGTICEICDDPKTSDVCGKNGMMYDTEQDIITCVRCRESFDAEYNAEEVLLCKKDDCHNERDMSVAWMGLCNPCYEVHQESCKGCREFERSKRENPYPPTDNWKKYNSECEDIKCAEIRPQPDSGTWTPATPLPHQVSDLSIYGRGPQIGTEKPSKPIYPKNSPSATNPINEPTWVKPMATGLGFILGFFGIKELKKVL